MPDFRFPALPPQAALDHLRAKGLKPSFDYRDVYREEHAYAFTVAKAMQLDILEDIHSALDNALAQGRTFQQFKKNLTPLLQKRGWWGKQEQADPLTGKIKTVQLGSPRRLKTIYRINLRNARAAGQWDRIEHTRQSHPYLLYQLGPSREHRQQHTAWAGILLPSNHPWWQTHFPPNGWGCKCRVRQVSQREYDRLVATGRYLTEAPPLNNKEWINKRTGEVVHVPDGIDPGFDINPGIARREYVQRVITTKLNNANPAIAQAAARDLVNSPAFDLFLRNPQGNYPVAALNTDLKHRLNTTQNAVQLSQQTLAKQRHNYPELNHNEYKLIPSLISQGDIIEQGGQYLTFYRQGKRLYKGVLKVIGKGELHVLSLQRTTQNQQQRDKRRGKIIRQKSVKPNNDNGTAPQ